VAREADGVRVASAHHLHRLRLLDLIEPLQGVAQLGGALVVGARARVEHAVAEPGADVGRLALEENQHVLDHPAVFFPALEPHAWRPAALDVVVETGAVGVVVRQAVVTRSHREDAADDLQGLPQRADIGVGTEVAGARKAHAAHYKYPRERLAHGDRDARIALVIREPDVEARLVLLDQVVLEEQRLRLARHHDGLEVGDRHVRRASGCRSRAVTAAYTTPKIPTAARARGRTPSPAVAAAAPRPARAAAPAPSTAAPIAHQCSGRSTAPMRRSKSRRCSTVLSVPPTDEPKAIPAGPNHRSSSQP